MPHRPRLPFRVFLAVEFFLLAMVGALIEVSDYIHHI